MYPEYDYREIDRYLYLWRRLSQCRSKFIGRYYTGQIRDLTDGFKNALAARISAGDPHAIPRFIYFMILQIDGYIPVDSRLAKAIAPIVGSAVPIHTAGPNRSYFAGDLYLWYRARRKDYRPYGPMAEWEAGEDAQRHVIPMYENVAQLPPQ